MNSPYRVQTKMQRRVPGGPVPSKQAISWSSLTDWDALLTESGLYETHNAAGMLRAWKPVHREEAKLAFLQVRG